MLADPLEHRRESFAACCRVSLLLYMLYSEAVDGEGRAGDCTRVWVVDHQVLALGTHHLRSARGERRLGEPVSQLLPVDAREELLLPDLPGGYTCRSPHVGFTASHGLCAVPRREAVALYWGLCTAARLLLLRTRHYAAAAHTALVGRARTSAEP